MRKDTTFPSGSDLKWWHSLREMKVFGFLEMRCWYWLRLFLFVLDQGKGHVLTVLTQCAAQMGLQLRDMRLVNNNFMTTCCYSLNHSGAVGCASGSGHRGKQPTISHSRYSGISPYLETIPSASLPPCQSRVTLLSFKAILLLL